MPFFRSDIQRSPREVGPLHHAFESESVLLCSRSRIESHAVVLNRQDQAPGIGSQLHDNGGGSSMANGIGHGFLTDSIQGRGQGFIDFRYGIPPKHAGNIGPLFKIRNQGLQGIGQTQVVQHPGTQPVGHIPDILNGFINEKTHFFRPAHGLIRRKRKMFFQPQNIDTQGG